jgi:hypothetical protein
MGVQPSFDSFRGPVVQQIDGIPRFQINNDRSIGMALPFGPII